MIFRSGAATAETSLFERQPPTQTRGPAQHTPGGSNTRMQAQLAKKEVHVLLVDDDPNVTRSLRTGLRNKPWTIHIADSGEQALAMCREQQFDVVVSDERMPGIQGSDLLTIIRTEQPDAVRITLSGQASLERAIHAINSAEIHRFLLKPCPQEEVALTIEELLARREDRSDQEELQQAPSSGPAALLERALDSLFIEFQPIFDARGRRYAFGALAKTDCPELKRPGWLLRLARSQGRSGELAARVREKIAALVPEIPTEALIFVPVEPDELEGLARSKGASPLTEHASRVVLALTEHRGAQPARDNSDALERLVGFGYRIAVNDLGAGDTGQDTVTLFTPSFVRFDPEMVRNVHRCPTKQAVIAAMTSLAASLGARTMAVGIRTAEEHEMIQSLGCDLFLGSFLGAATRDFKAA